MSAKHELRVREGRIAYCTCGQWEMPLPWANDAAFTGGNSTTLRQISSVVEPFLSGHLAGKGETFWCPTVDDLRGQAKMYMRLRPGGVWGVPCCCAVLRVDREQCHVAVASWQGQNSATMERIATVTQLLGWQFVAGPGGNHASN